MNKSQNKLKQKTKLNKSRDAQRSLRKTIQEQASRSALAVPPPMVGKVTYSPPVKLARVNDNNNSAKTSAPSVPKLHQSRVETEVKEEVKEIKPRIRSASRGRSTSNVLRRMNPYYMTLAHPSQYVGVRIPDVDYDYSAAFTIVKKFAFAMDTGNSGGVLISYAGQVSDSSSNFIPLPINLNTQGSNTQYVVGLVNSALGNQNYFTTSGIAASSQAAPIVFENWNSSTNAVEGAFRSVRLVSAGLAVECSGSRYTAAGTYTAASLPKGFLRDTAISAITPDVIKNYPGAILTPVNQFTGVSLTYNPTDPSCFDYQRVDQTSGEETWGCAPGAFVVTVDGCPAGTFFNCTLVCNYEAIPRSDTLSFISIAPTLNDPLALAEAENARQDDSLVVANTKGFGGLDESSRSHALYRTVEDSPNSSKDTLFAIHKTPLYCPCSTGLGSRPKPESREQKSMFENLLGMVLPLVQEAAPALLAAL